VAEEFTRLCVAKTKTLRVGCGEDPTTEVGPLIRDRQVRLVEEQLAEALSQGAEVLAGGRRPDFSEARERGSPRAVLAGFFYEPTVLTKVHHRMRIMREETFGPVLPIMAVENDEQALELANDSEFGLSASIWTRDQQRGERLARALQAGAVMVNDCISYFGICEAPHGGVKSSGIGRTHSRLGLQEMVRVKYIDVDLVPGLPKLWWFGYDATANRLMEGFLDFLFARGLRGRARGLGAMLGNLRGRYRKLKGDSIDADN